MQPLNYDMIDKNKVIFVRQPEYKAETTRTCFGLHPPRPLFNKEDVNEYVNKHIEKAMKKLDECVSK